MPALALPEELFRNSEKGVFAGLGISLPEAVRYESRIREKATFVFVSCDDVPQSEWARELLIAMGAEEANLLRANDQGGPTREETGALINQA